MKKNKVLMGAMGLLLFGMAATQVQAEEMTVTYTEPNEYAIRIPKTIDLSNGQADEQITVEHINIAPDKHIALTISNGVDTQGTMYLQRVGDTNTKVKTTVSNTKFATGIPLNDVFAQFTNASDQTTISLSKIATEDGSEVKAGDYQGILTFQYEIQDN